MPPDKMQSNWREQLITFAYLHFLGRAPNDVDISGWSAALDGILTPTAFLERIASSEEAAQRTQATVIAVDQDRALRQRRLVELAYRGFLQRLPEEAGYAYWTAELDRGLAAEAFIEAVAKSDEALHRLEADQLGAGLTDGEFLIRASRFLFGRGLLPHEVVSLQRRIELSPWGRLRLAVDQLNTQLCPAPSPTPPADQACIILGTSRTLSKREWNKRRECLPEPRHSPTTAVPDLTFTETGSIKVSMIASLYRGGRFIERFLQNITSQTMFHSCELIIIDADSPENERDVIERYQKLFANIVYKRVDVRIGIYDAWNLGVTLARGAYLTNTNVDDLRRHDSIALQAAFLDNNPGVDVAYQDFYYTLDSSLTFEEAAEFGFRSELPIITRHNLLGCNSPHNAPMWRKSLHKSVGLFDTKYQSGGDHEFWLRCLLASHSFGKINTSHVVYFQNPEGMSTKPDTPGVQESYEIFNNYSAKVIAPALLDTRQGFMKRLGRGEVPESGDVRSYYDIAQEALLRLAESQPTSTPSVQERAVDGPGEQRNLRVLLDGLCFQRKTDICGAVFAVLSVGSGVASGITLFVLDRGECPLIEGIQRVDFPSYHGTYTAADSLLIQDRCDALGIDVFTSTENTTALSTPQLQIVSEGWRLKTVSDHAEREEKEHRLAVAYSSRIACVSELARAQLLRQYPSVEPTRVLPLYTKQPMANTRSDEAKLWLRLCNAWRETAASHLNATTVPFYRDWKHIRWLQAEVDVGID